MTSKLDQLKNQDSATQFKSPKQVARNTALELSSAASTSAERGFVVRGARIRTWLTPHELWVSDFGVLGTTWNACPHQPGLRFIVLQVCFLCLFTSILCLNTTHVVIYKGQKFNFFSSWEDGNFKFNVLAFDKGTFVKLYRAEEQEMTGGFLDGRMEKKRVALFHKPLL